jgi:hypothetical protein
MKRISLFFGGLALALAIGGCQSKPAMTDPARRGPFFTPHNYLGDQRMPDSLQRVVILPVHGGEFAPPETVEALDPVFATALERQMRFEVVTITREEFQKSFGVPDLSSTDALPHDFLQVLGQKYAADAVLFIDLTAFHGYRPLTLGVRAKLVAIDSRRLVWAFDEIFSASDPAVANSARHFYAHNELGSVPYDLTPGALQSPDRFSAYAADTAFRTLPPR